MGEDIDLGLSSTPNGCGHQPDGSYIAYLVSEHGVMNVWVAAIKGADPDVQLTSRGT